MVREEWRGSSVFLSLPASARAYALRFSLLFGAYLLVALIGLRWALLPGAASPVWPAAGVALAGLLLGGRNLWPAIVLGRIAAAILEGGQLPFPVIAAISAGNGFAALAGATLIQHFSARIPRVATGHDLTLVFAGGFLAAVISAAIGNAALFVSGQLTSDRLAETMSAWTAGSLVGSFIVAPAIFAWSDAGSQKWSRQRTLHFAAALSVTAVVSFLIFHGENESRGWFVFPVLVWIALALPVPASATALIVTAAIAIAGTSSGLGPFGPELVSDPRGGLVLLQFFLSVTALTILYLAVTADERRSEALLRAAADTLAAREAQLALAIEHAPAAIAMFDRDMRYIAASRRFSLDYRLNGRPLIGQSHYEVFPTLPQRWRETYRETLATGQSFSNDADRFEDENGDEVWVRWAIHPWRKAGGEIGGLVLFSEVITEQVKARNDLNLRTEELHALLDNAPIGTAYFDRDHRYVRVNDHLAEINGVPRADHLGQSIEELLPVNAVAVGPVIDEIFATGKPIGNLEVTGQTPREPGVERCWLTGFFPVRDAEGDVQSVGAWVTEITERKRAEERERLLAREVDHRAKNLLAVVQSVVQLTRADDKESFQVSVTGRIQSLARAHGLLAEARWEGADLAQLVNEELAPFAQAEPGKVRVEGPRLLLRPAAAQSIGLVLHELATNAAKYGALRGRAAKGARLSVVWALTNGELRLELSEPGAVRGRAPNQGGFGSRMIKASVERQLKGTVDYHWHDSGLTIRLAIPGDHVAGRAEDAGRLERPSPGRPDEPADLRHDRCRVLIVEDEAMIGLQLEQNLSAAGCEIVGVATTVEEALDLIDRRDPAGAVVDINLGGTASFPVGDRLLEKGVPFVFCSGYADDAAIPERFAHVPLLVKPFESADIVSIFTRRAEQG